jgi:hypothetical protein
MFLPAIPDGYLPQTSVNNIRNCGTVLRAKKSNTGVDLGRLGASLRRDNTVVSGGGLRERRVTPLSSLQLPYYI